MEGASLGFLIFVGLLRAVTGWEEETALALESFAVFGHVQIHPRNFSREICTVHVSVHLDAQEWRRELTGEFYIFRVSLSRYMRLPGLIDVSLLTDLQEVSLWRRVFIVDETGGHQADAVLTLPSYLNCSPRIDEQQKAAEAAGNLAPFTAFTSVQELEVCLPLNIQTCASLGNTSDATEAEIPAVFVEREELEEDDDWKEEGTQGPYMVFGSPCLRPWQLAALLVTGALLQLHVLLLRGFTSSSAPLDLCYSEHPAAAWELCTFTSSSRKGCRPRNVVATGTGCFNKAWSDAEQLLWRCDEACFSYNCSSGKSTKTWGKWNRDGFGRLIRS